MDKIFSIGETAKINNISIKALRVYDEMDLLKPQYVDPHNGYRYYTYDQFSYIDKIKRFKNVGMTLKELREVFMTKELSRIEDFLSRQKENLEEESRRLEEKQQRVQCLRDFFEYSKTLETSSEITIRHFEERRIINVPASKGDSMYAMDMELRNVLSSEGFLNIQSMNPYGYILDYESLMENRIMPLSSTVSIAGEITTESKYFEILPKGSYACCYAKILAEKVDISYFITYCRQNGIKATKVIAFEYLKSLYDPANSPYEIQVLI